LQGKPNRLLKGTATREAERQLKLAAPPGQVIAELGAGLGHQGVRRRLSPAAGIGLVPLAVKPQADQRQVGGCQHDGAERAGYGGAEQ
jgi:hypothetical protein